MRFGETSEEQPYEVFECRDVLRKRLHELGDELWERVGANRTNLIDGFRGMRAVPIVAHYVQGMALIRVNGQPSMSPFATIHVNNFAGASAIDENAWTFLDQLAYSIRWGGPFTVPNDGPPASDNEAAR